MIEDDLTYTICGCAIKVYKTMGNRFQEVIYQRCLAIELGQAGIEFLREQEMPTFYDGINVGTSRAASQLWIEQHGSKASLPEALLLFILFQTSINTIS